MLVGLWTFPLALLVNMYVLCTALKLAFAGKSSLNSAPSFLLQLFMYTN